MRIWKLEAVDPSDPVWKQYNYPDPIFVRAKSESRARIVVQLAISNLVPALGSTASSPWAGEKTTCVPCSDSGFSPDGPEEVLSA